jgi:hypothetical protein
MLRQFAGMPGLGFVVGVAASVTCGIQKERSEIVTSGSRMREVIVIRDSFIE